MSISSGINLAHQALELGNNSQEKHNPPKPKQADLKICSVEKKIVGNKWHKGFSPDAACPLNYTVSPN